MKIRIALDGTDSNKFFEVNYNKINDMDKTWDSGLLKYYTYDKIQKDYSDALDFVKKYYSSPGFKERFDNYKKNILPKYNKYMRYNTKPIDINYKNGKFPEVPLVVTNSPNNIAFYHYSSNPSKNRIEIGPVTAKTAFVSTGFLTLRDILTHELGHNLDYHLSSNNPNNLYSSTYQILGRNKLFKQSPWRDKYKNPNSAILPHDARFKESYADMLAFREQLQGLGIYDSMKANNPFKQEHLDKFRKKFPKNAVKLRLFRYFDDEDIIEMMNTIAQNNNNDNETNVNYYA